MNKKIIIAIVAVIALGGGAAYVLTKKDDSAKQAATSTTTSSNSGSKSESSKYSDACKIFTKENVSAALGGTYADGAADVSTRSSDGLEGSACRYEQNSDGTTSGLTQALGLTVSIDNYKNEDNAKAFFEQYSAVVIDEGKDISLQTTKVDGVGDQGIFVVAHTAFDAKTEVLYVRVGKQIIVMTATRLAGIDHAAVRANMTTLAKNL